LLLRQTLQKYGWTDGRNVQIEPRWIGRDVERRNPYAIELVNLSPDVIFACFSAQLAALLRATHLIPIVFVGVSDPVTAVITGLCDSPLTFQAIIIWRDELNDGLRPVHRAQRHASSLPRYGRAGSS
jgi:hypothetical protein